MNLYFKLTGLLILALANWSKEHDTFFSALFLFAFHSTICLFILKKCLCGSLPPQRLSVCKFTCSLCDCAGFQQVQASSHILKNVIFQILNVSVNPKNGLNFDWPKQHFEHERTVSGDKKIRMDD